MAPSDLWIDLHRYAALTACLVTAGLVSACDSPQSPSAPFAAAPAQAVSVIQPPDHRFDGRWTLIKVGDAPTPKELRSVYLDINGDSVFGYNGCNEFLKSLTSGGLSTLVACPDASTLNLDINDIFAEDPADGLLVLQKKPRRPATLTFQRITQPE